MYTPPMFKPDRAASLAFAQARGFGTGLRVGRHQADRLVAAVLPRLRRRRHAAGGVSCRASQSAGKAGGRNIVLADGGHRRGRLCVARLVRLAGSGADLALPGRASDRPGADVVRTTNSAEQIDTLSAKFEELAVAEDSRGRRRR